MHAYVKGPYGGGTTDNAADLRHLQTPKGTRTVELYYFIVYW